MQWICFTLSCAIPNDMRMLFVLIFSVSLYFVMETKRSLHKSHNIRFLQQTLWFTFVIVIFINVTHWFAKPRKRDYSFVWKIKGIGFSSKQIFDFVIRSYRMCVVLLEPISCKYISFLLLVVWITTIAILGVRYTNPFAFVFISFIPLRPGDVQGL